MKRDLRVLAVVGAVLLALSAAHAAFAQKQDGVLKIYFFDSPASVSIHEETTAAGQGPVMGSSIIWSCISRTCRKTAYNRSFRTSRASGHGTRTRPS